MAARKVGFIVHYKKDTIYSFNALVAALENDPKTQNLDIYYIRDKHKLHSTIKNALKHNEKVVLGLSLFTTEFWEVSEIIKKLKAHFKDKVIVIGGGPHPSGDPKGTLKMGFDYVFIGEAEDSIVEFFSFLKRGKDIINIPGIAYFDEDNNFIYKKKTTFIDLDDYPPFPLKNSKFGAIEITRGCPYKCYFCQTSFIMGNTARHRSIEEICKYIRILKSEDLVDIRFITPNAFSYGSKDGKSVNLQKLEELLSRVKEIIGKEGRIFYGSFPSEVRPEHVNEEVLNIILNYANNDNIIIGGQSGSQRMLELCNRGHDVNDIYKAVKITHKFGLKANVDFIFGLPNENEEDRRETRKLMKHLIKMGAKIHAHTFIPLPKTPFSNESPRKIDNKTRKFIKRNLANIYGSWKKHEKFAFKIWEKLNKKD